MSQGVTLGTSQYEERLKRVYYEGSDIVYTGYTVCYNFDYGVAANAVGDRAVRVEKPETDNLEYCAGWVHPKSNGVKGPDWIWIVPNEPGAVAEVYTDQNCSGSWGILLYPQTASYAMGAVNSVAGTGITVSRGFAKTLQQVNRSTPGTVLAKLGLHVQIA